MKCQRRRRMPSSYLGAHGNLAVDPVEGADTEEVNLYFLAYTVKTKRTNNSNYTNRLF